MIDEQHFDPVQLLDLIIDAGIRDQQARMSIHATNVQSPGEMFFGWFASPDEATEVMDDITQMIYEERKISSTRDIGLYSAKASKLKCPIA